MNQKWYNDNDNDISAFFSRLLMGGGGNFLSVSVGSRRMGPKVTMEKKIHWSQKNSLKQKQTKKQKKKKKKKNSVLKMK